MQFLTPGIAAFAAALALPSLVLLYFLKLRRRKVKVPTTLLWQQAADDLQVNTPFQRFKNSLLFWAQLLAVLCLLFALARPVWTTGPTQADHVVVLIDHSASMNATDVGPSRLAEAKKQALQLIDSLETQPVSVIAFNDQATILADQTTDKNALRRAINRIEPTDRGSNPLPALRLLEPLDQRLAQSQHELAVFVFSDGRITTPGTPGTAPGSRSQTTGQTEAQQADDAAVTAAIAAATQVDWPILQATQLVHRPIGSDEPSRRANAAIATFSLRRDLTTPENVQMLAQVVWAGPKPLIATADLMLDGVRIRSFPLQLPAASATGALPRQTLRTDFAHVGQGLLTLQLHVNDSLAADDTARLQLAPAQSLRVLVVTDRPQGPVATIATAYGLDDLTTTDAEGYREQWKKGLPRVAWSAEQATATPNGDNNDPAGFDLVVFDGVAPDAENLPTINALYFGAAPPLAGLTRQPAESNDHSIHPVIRLHPDHPLMRHVVMGEQLFYKPGRLQVPDDATILATLDSGPAIAEITRQNVRHVVVSPPLVLLQDAPWQWPYQLSYLAFMHNAMESLGLGQMANSAGLAHTPGQAVAWPAPSTAAHYDGPERLTPRPMGSQAVFPTLNRVGIYKADGNVQAPYDQLVVNLTNAVESDTRPVDTLPIPVAASAPGSAPGNGNSSNPSGSASSNGGAGAVTAELGRLALWPYALFVAMGLVLWEWWLYIRRAKI